MEPIIWVPAVAAIVSAVIAGSFATLIYGINTLVKTNERVAFLEAGQEQLRQGQAKLEQGQEDLRQSQAKLEQGQAKLEQGQEDLRQGQAKLGEVLYEILLLLNNPRSSSGGGP